VSDVNAALVNVTVKLAMSSAFRCEAAVPVRASVAVVAEVLVTTAVKPAGTLATVTLPPRVNAPTKVSPESVRVRVLAIVPLLEVASVKLPEL
jgi:hypothetical protein